MPRFDYRRADLTEVLASLPLAPGDVLFCHSNLGFFGRMEGARDAATLCDIFLAEIMERIAPGGTLVVPTFTYSFPRREIFDTNESRSGMGLFAEYIRRHKDALRSWDPCYSVAAIGAHAAELTQDVPINSFAETSFFDRFARHNGKVLNLNFDAGSTFVHFVERQLTAPYRFDKTFAGVIRAHGIQRPANSTIWVRYLSDDALEAEFTAFDELARAERLFAAARLGRGELGTISAAATSDLIVRTMPSRPLFLTKAEKRGITTPLIIPELTAAVTYSSSLG